MTPSLYDLLDVDSTATSEEIRAAWKAAIADLEPTDRRFRAYNDAAGVLLDPVRRAEYDDQLAARLAEDPEPAAARAQSPAATPVKAPVPVSGTDASTPVVADVPRRSRFASAPPGWAFGAAAVAAVLSLALAVVLLLQPGGRLFSGDDSPHDVAERNSNLERSGVEAEAAAERMVGPVLSYDYRTMGADLERIRAQMTPKMGAKQAKGWDKITEEATAQKIVVQATAAASALTRVSSDGRRASVVVFIDQQVHKGTQEPFTLKMWATFSLVHDGGHWLLADLCTDSDCG